VEEALGIETVEPLLEPQRLAARSRLADALQTNREVVTSDWIGLVARSDPHGYTDLSRYIRSLVTGLCEVFRNEDWTLAQTIIDSVAGSRARNGLPLEHGFQRAVMAGRHAIRPFVGKSYAEVEELLIETLNECAFRYFESYQGIRLATENDRLYTRIIKSLVMALEARDPYTKGHSISVALLCEKLAEVLGIDPSRAYLSGLLHDVGKVGIPDRILSKAGPLDPQEWAQMRAHPLTGANILRPIKLYPEVVASVLSHHENYDGTGYPHGLAGEDIPLTARVIRVVDSFDAMTSRRVFRESRTVDDTLAELKRLRGQAYDPLVVDHLEELVGAPGTLRELNLASLTIDVGDYAL
jgi:putative nucleotidyltransferase with HDIG domain